MAQGMQQMGFRDLQDIIHQSIGSIDRKRKRALSFAWRNTEEGQPKADIGIGAGRAVKIYLAVCFFAISRLPEHPH